MSTIRLKCQVDPMAPVVLECGHCGCRNVVARCDTCDRPFVVTSGHLAGKPRSFEASAVFELPSSLPPYCDFCSESSPIQRVNAGLRQRTCAGCHTEFLSAHSL